MSAERFAGAFGEPRLGRMRIGQDARFDRRAVALAVAAIIERKDRHLVAIAELLEIRPQIAHAVAVAMAIEDARLAGLRARRTSRGAPCRRPK